MALSFIRGLLRVFRVAYSKQGKSDTRTPYERFAEWYESKGEKMTRMDRVGFGLIFNVMPIYIRAMFWATILGFIFWKIYDIWGLEKMVVSVAITLYLKIHFSMWALESKLKK